MGPSKKATLTVELKKPKAARLRSPSYPGIDLQVALKRAKEFYDVERRSPAKVEVAVRHWGFKPKSSGGMIAIAALKAFGLLTETGSGKTRKVQLSESAFRILLDQRPYSQERAEAIKQAAFRPRLHTALWGKYQADLPSDEDLRHELIFEWRFNENTVSDFIKEYKETMRFAKLTASDTISGDEADTTEESEMPGSQELPRMSNPTVKIIKPSEDAGKGIIPLAEISVPVGVTEEGKAIFAHLRFDAPLKKGMLSSLRQLLDALEKNLS